MKSIFKLFAFSLLSLQFALAQSTVTGVVTDPDGLPLPGATVFELGTSNGVSSDFDGNYSIDVAEGATLVFSFYWVRTTTNLD